MANPNPFHYAVAVGINAYPGGYKPLSGPVNDARAFVDWLVDPEQGGLPARNVELIITPKKTPAKPATAKPTKQLIDEALWEAHENLNQAIGAVPEEDQAAARAASRLYFFVAGHGILPGDGEAALLDATARPRFQPNIELGSYVSWMAKNGAFAEVCAFADCCRSYELLATAGQPFFSAPPRVGGRVVTLLGFATSAGDLSFEEIGSAEEADLRRGFFSKVLIEGLRGNAADPKTGLVTTSGLRAYVGPVVATLTRDKPVPQHVELYSADDMVFGPVRVSAAVGRPPGRTARKVVINFPADFGDSVELVAPDGARMTWEPVDGPWTVRLYDGEWYVQRPGSNQDSMGLVGDGLVSVAGEDRVVDL
ncbi:MAG: caspase family protein [Candidatus Nanopelagicales bacterium]